VQLVPTEIHLKADTDSVCVTSSSSLKYVAEFHDDEAAYASAADALATAAFGRFPPTLRGLLAHMSKLPAPLHAIDVLEVTRISMVTGSSAVSKSCPRIIRVA
jgi:hypothetical protein